MIMLPSPPNRESAVLHRSVDGARALLRLASGEQLETRRFLPAGQRDSVRVREGLPEVWIRHDEVWLPLEPSWTWRTTISLGGQDTVLTFKEIETDEEFRLFGELRRFHYRGGGGAGRTVPIIAHAHRWDLPRVLGFLELTSSLIASTARKRFFDAPFFESGKVQWQSWNSQSARDYSNLICRISRFVIHPELRGAGLARPFLAAARDYAAKRWHYGGWRPRFMEITADMLRYYQFVDGEFAFMGETEGNEHRLAKDMTYLVRKALTEGQMMPQGGGGIMTLQRGYASRLLTFTGDARQDIAQLVQQLSRNPAALDQDAWEALHRLNRRPKPAYVCGLTPEARQYVKLQNTRLNPPTALPSRPKIKSISIDKLGVSASSAMEQTSEGRKMQETFGFVGSAIHSDLFHDVSFELKSGEVTLVCGASGSGKSLFLAGVRAVCDPAARTDWDPNAHLEGRASRHVRIGELPHLPDDVSALALKGAVELERFLNVTGKCGLAEPQLLVRPIRTLSSGQKYRLAVALAFLQECEVLLIDNFCEPLDRYTAAAVAKGIRRLAREENVSVLAATATYDRSHLLGEIDQAILLRRGDKAMVVGRGQDHGLQESLLERAFSNPRPEHLQSQP